MARKKKNIEEYVEAGFRDTLVKISIKYNVEIEKLRELNPDIRFIIAGIPKGRKVRIS